jgi:hypothetical protein
MLICWIFYTPEAALPGTLYPPTTAIMTVRPTVRYPDPRLALPRAAVTVVDGVLRDLARDLVELAWGTPNS